MTGRAQRGRLALLERAERATSALLDLADLARATLTAALDRPRPCAQCGAPVVRRSDRGRRPTYCSQACRPAQRRFHRGPPVARSCAACGRPLMTGYLRQRFCSPECRTVQRGALAVEE